MHRSFSSPALVLRVRSSGESNREAVFLSAQEGIISATLFGGPKSRLRSHVSPFNSGLLWTYRDPAKEFRKVSDFDVQSWRPGLRELYERSNTASLVVKAILDSHGGGDTFAETFVIANAALDALECADEPCCSRVLIHFLWKWAGLLGSRGTGLRYCSSCACEFPGDAVIWFIPGEGFLCKNCLTTQSGDNSIKWAGKSNCPGLSGPARRWLLTVENKHPLELPRYSLDAVSLGELITLTGMLGKQ